MPQITNVTLHSFSSEDPNFPASNLLETKVTKKWKCRKPGEKTAFVVLKFDKPYTLTEIDVGNEYSAVIEIFVANSLQDPPQFQEIILASSLMTIIDAKSEKNPNRVKMFNKGVFIPSVADKKWDLIKIVCTQTFNNHKQFGLSFVNFHTNEETTSSDDDSPIKPVRISLPPAEKTPGTSKSTKTIGKFRFRDSNSSDEEETSPFAKWKNKKANLPSTSSSHTPDTKSTIKEQLKAKLDSENKRKRVIDDEKPKEKHDRNRSKGLFYDSSDDEPNAKLQKKIDKDKKHHESKDQNSQRNSIKVTPTTPSSSNKYSSFINDEKIPAISSPKSSSTSKKREENRPIPKKVSDKEIKYKPFDKLMEGVVFVISGYQNPERGILRQKAIDLGAKYKADWDDSCTHLICAYSNTPKYNQVRGKGKIVSKKWIENCFIEQKMIPWRRYALDNSDKNKPESDDEILCEWHKPNDSTTTSNEGRRGVSEESDDDMVVVDRRGKSDTKIVIDDSESDDDMAVVNKTNKITAVVDDVDVKVEDKQNDCINTSQQQEDSNNNKNNSQTIDVWMNSDESDVSSIDITTVECQVFKDKLFYLNEDLTATDIIKLKDNIKNMLGIVTKNPYKANYIITKMGKKLPLNVKGEVVKEIWIRECFELQALIPTARYKLSQ